MPSPTSTPSRTVSPRMWPRRSTRFASTPRWSESSFGGRLSGLWVARVGSYPVLYTIFTDVQATYIGHTNCYPERRIETRLPDLAAELGTTERTLRRAVAQGLFRAERPSPRTLDVPLAERVYLRRSWPLLSALRAALRTEPAVSFAVLFGSRARGEEHGESDIDLLVTLREGADRWVLAGRLAQRVGANVQLVELADALAAPLLLAEVVREGRVLVDREGFWPQLRRRRPQIERDAARERRRIDDEFEPDPAAEMTVRLDHAGLVIRPFAPDDVGAVVALWEAAGLTRPWNDPRKDIARKLRVQPEWFLVAIAGAEIVGSVMAGYDGHRGWVNYLAVAQTSRRAGVGRALMAEVERVLHEAGCPKINLLIRGANHAAVIFYEALGYTPDDVISLGRRLEHDTPH